MPNPTLVLELGAGEQEAVAEGDKERKLVTSHVGLCNSFLLLNRHYLWKQGLRVPLGIIYKAKCVIYTPSIKVRVYYQSKKKSRGFSQSAGDLSQSDLAGTTTNHSGPKVVSDLWNLKERLTDALCTS